MDNEKKEGWKAVGKIIIALIIAPISYFCKGLVISKLWVWFIVPMFGLPNFSIPYFLGLAIVVSFLTEKVDFAKKDDREYESFTTRIFSPIGYYFMILLLGFIIKQFI